MTGTISHHKSRLVTKPTAVATTPVRIIRVSGVGARGELRSHATNAAATTSKIKTAIISPPLVVKVHTRRRNGHEEERVADDKSPSQLIDERIKELGDWRGEMLSRLRALVKEADPDVVEEWKWRGVPTWYHDGIICTGETYKSVVKMTFAKGAALKDPSGLFNSSLEGNTQACHRLPRGREDQREGVEGSRSRRRGPEHVQSQALIREAAAAVNGRRARPAAPATGCA